MNRIVFLPATLLVFCIVQMQTVSSAYAEKSSSLIMVQSSPNFDSLITLAAHKFCGDIMNKKRSLEADKDALALITRIDAQLKKTPADSALLQMRVNAHGLHLFICAFGLQLDSTLTPAQFSDATSRMNEVQIRDATPPGSCVQITRLWINVRTWYFFQNNSGASLRVDYNYESPSGRTEGFGSEFLLPHSVVAVYDDWVEIGLMGEDWINFSDVVCPR
jgi:hypothetical protein